jgi:hypothetical protein
MLFMKTTTQTPGRRVALLPVEDRAAAGHPAIRRYRLARVIDDLGAYVAAAPTAASGAVAQAPVRGVRAP